MQQEDNTNHLEAKIVSKIATDIFGQNAKLFVMTKSGETKNSFAQFIQLVNSCEEANFIFVQKGSTFDNNKCNKNGIYFTDNKQLFFKNENFAGAFYWLKNRPNIVFSSNRLKSNKIKLPASYEQFIEEIE